MAIQQIKVTPLASLDWPKSLPKGCVQCGTEAYLAYKARTENRIPLLHFSKFSSISNSSHSSDIDMKDVMKSKRSSSKQDKDKTNAVDLNTLKPDELENLSYYTILGGIKMHSTPEQVKRAFHKSCLKYHPDKEDSSKNAEGDDPIFLKVKEAFETLSDATKRKAYDSTVDFDESIPSASDIRKDRDFYKVFGKCFEKNLRFAAENDPDQAAAAAARKQRQKQMKKGRRGDSNNKKQKYSGPPDFGDDDTIIDSVHEFYDFWVKFQSWRDFTLPATKLTEHDTDMADSRYEKRWMEKEIARKAKAMKKDEMARITKLVERSMSLDPRLKRERQRLEKEKKEKQRLKEEKAANEEKERKEKEEAEANEKAEKEMIEKQQKAEMKAKREQEKKILRKAKQSFRRLVLAEHNTDNQNYENGKIDNPTWTSIDDMNDDVETLCAKLAATDLDDLTKEVSSGGSEGSKQNSKLQLIQEKANSMRGEEEKAKKANVRKRELMRMEAKRKEDEARKAKASRPWSKEEISALSKAVKKYPAGGANRWETIALFINSSCQLAEPRKKEECIEKYNQSAASRPKPANNAGVSSAKNANSKVNEWSDAQNKLLQNGLSMFKSSMDKNERWTCIAKGVPGKTKKECVARYKAIREALQNK